MKGLKELVEAAMGEFAPPKPPPVDVSGEVTRVLSHLMRRWSGWRDAALTFGEPHLSPFGETDMDNHEFIINVDALVLNPNRVLNTITPFRLKQEAVMTGVMMHEAGHARHSRWRKPANMVHGDNGTHRGEEVTAQTLAFAGMMEEPRVEGLFAREAAALDAASLVWTMRAATAALAPFTELSSDPDQQIMDILNSYVLRAGKQIGVAQWTDYTLPKWVGYFNQFVHQCLTSHMENENGLDKNRADINAAKVMSWMTMMILCPDDTGTYMVDIAREILDLLYPNGSSAAPQAGCQGATGGAESGDQRSDEGQDGEGNSDPADPGSGEDPGAGVSGNGDEDENGASPSTEIQQGLAKMEGTAQAATTDEADQQSAAMEAGGMAGGKGPGSTDERGYRVPTAEERGVKSGAERFLRDLIEPTDASRVLLSDQPSSNVDAALYAAWRADGGVRQPHFFRRTKRTVQPAPPVDIAVLVDISSSMNLLQKPSALLSWALSSACTDLRNFAGRGQQIRSTLIHWGDSVRVIQPVGQTIPGLKEYDCREGTSAMGLALEETERQMPGFFDSGATPSNRLLVHFTDWELYGQSVSVASSYTHRALAAGVNILSVVPAGYSVRRSKLPDVLEGARIQRGKVQTLKYNPGMPSQVWDVAAELLNLEGDAR